MTFEIGLPPKIGLQVSMNEELLHSDRHFNAATGWLKMRIYTVEALGGFAAPRGHCCIKELAWKLCEETPQSLGIQKNQVQLFLLFLRAQAARLQNPDGNRKAFLFYGGIFSCWARLL